MNRATFFKHFELLADQPDAVAKMRGLVLNLAVSGRLVTHDDDPKDNAWQKQILLNKNQTIATLKLKRHPETRHLTTGELPYNLPEQWMGVRLGDLTYSCPTSYGEHPSPELTPAGVITVGNIDNAGFFKGQFSERGFPPNEFEELVARKGDLVVVKSSGSAENVHSGKTALCTAEHDAKIVGSNFVMRLRLFGKGVLPEFLWLVMKSRITRAWVEQTVQTMTYPNLKWSEYAQLPVGLPPLAEQRRIVAKVEELMALCDELEQRQHARHNARQCLAQAAFHHLTTAKDPAEFRKRFNFILQHSAFILDEVPQLRQAILQLAVQGKLVPHERMRNESEKIPPGWRNVKVGEVAECRLGKMLDQQKNSGTLRPYLKLLKLEKDVPITHLYELQKKRNAAVHAGLLARSKARFGKSDLTCFHHIVRHYGI
ncbi:MAG: restriction endonuclease subunit S [Limisphaerales bacterium]